MKLRPFLILLLIAVVIGMTGCRANDTPTPSPSVPTAIPPATATPSPVPCTDGSQFVKDVTVPDGSVMQPGQHFNKTWRMKNIGTCPWDSSFKLVFVSGNAMGGQPAAVPGVVNPGNTADLTVGMIAPTTPGDAQGWWQMVNPKNVAFGPRIWVDIYVMGPPTPKPPTAVAPTPVSKPVINSFSAQPTTINQNDKITVSWSFTGTGLSAATLTRTDPDGTVVPLYGGGDVPMQGSYMDIGAIPGTVTYKLSVSNQAGNATAMASVMVNALVINPLPAP